ncbi:hypothetical protein BGZ80_002540 [Entomortierella chlamydospora]|uniref:BTB domain-containing protein n=1 Tax=Entomortierella chlamydospora TaxID=101097 RepID=A0A9P6T389_9FUNG|nr:hypothetical protein BGZ79_006899 [Entomortierella chlamydospora]KAG0021375.1 hypothetical protein BGZ80_002540 [Entomortierella chlamydospora]
MALEINSTHSALSTKFRIELLSTIDESENRDYGNVDTTTPDGSSWSVKLTRSFDFFTVGISWIGNPRSAEDYMFDCPYKHIHIASQTSQGGVTVNACYFWDRQPAEATIEARKVFHEGKYVFDISISTEKKLPEKQIDVLESRPQDIVIRNHDIMSILLKDIYSVDVCFVFDSDKSCSNVGLWAHRAVLSRYKGFGNVIHTACRDMSLSSEDPASGSLPSPTTARDDGSLGPLLISVEQFTMATLCVLLRYVYTGQVELSAEADKHAISMTESIFILQGIMSRCKESVRWHPLDPNSQWKFKDVTWEELLLASDYYGVMDLKSRCEKEVISAIDQSTVVKTLFTIGNSFLEVKESALDFIIQNMTLIFPKGKDPFAEYKSHPMCHELLIEIINRKASNF